VLLIINRHRTPHHRDVERVRDSHALLRASIPAINLEVCSSAQHIRAALREVERTLMIAMVLVICRIRVPAQRPRDAHSAVAVPFAVATFASCTSPGSARTTCP